MIREDAQPVRLTRAELDAMREAAEVDQRDPRGNDGVAMVKAVERIIWDRLYVVASPARSLGQIERDAVAAAVTSCCERTDAGSCRLPFGHDGDHEPPSTSPEVSDR